jgi:hypothetical protein
MLQLNQRPWFISSFTFFLVLSVHTAYFGFLFQIAVVADCGVFFLQPISFYLSVYLSRVSV